MLAVEFEVDETGATDDDGSVGTAGLVLVAGVEVRESEVGATDDEVGGGVGLVAGGVVGGPTGGPDGELADAALAGVMDTTCTSGTVHTAAAPTTAPFLRTSRRVTPELITVPLP